LSDRPTQTHAFLTPDETTRIEAAVADAERATSAQIKVVLTRHCWFSLERKAAKIFTRLGLDRTTQRNCVMILLVTANHQFAVYGDRGIHAKVGSVFWQGVRDVMQTHFRADRFAEGLSACVDEVGRQLIEHFPRQDHADELHNRIEYVD
jgi:uncharacterized membrane protein